MQHRNERVYIETDRHRISGLPDPGPRRVPQPRLGPAQRVGARLHLADRLRRRGHRPRGPGTRHDFIAVSRRHIVFAIPETGDGPPQWSVRARRADTAPTPPPTSASGRPPASRPPSPRPGPLPPAAWSCGSPDPAAGRHGQAPAVHQVVTLPRGTRLRLGALPSARPATTPRSAHRRPAPPARVRVGRTEGLRGAPVVFDLGVYAVRGRQRPSSSRPPAALPARRRLALHRDVHVPDRARGWRAGRDALGCAPASAADGRVSLRGR